MAGCEFGGCEEGNNYNRPNPKVQLFNFYRKTWMAQMSEFSQRPEWDFAAKCFN